MLTGLYVAARIVANPVSNAFQKQLTRHAVHPLFIIGTTHALLTVAVLPLLLGPTLLILPTAFWWNITFCVVLAVASNVLLVQALKTTDLSILGPINAYKAVLSLILGVFVIGEIPTAMGVAGVLLILAGSGLVVDRLPNQPRHHAFLQFFRERGIQLRLAALMLSATEAVFLKKALLLSSPLTTFVWWSILGFPLAATAILVLLRTQATRELPLFRQHWRTFLWLALTTGVMQLTTLLTFGQLSVGYSLALFQLSTLISVFLGYRYFREGNIRRRLLGSLVMVCGAVMIVTVGRTTGG
jgi:drug/metabolite transporter (DMT)-like permease